MDNGQPVYFYCIAAVWHGLAHTYLLLTAKKTGTRRKEILANTDTNTDADTDTKTDTNTDKLERASPKLSASDCQEIWDKGIITQM